MTCEWHASGNLDLYFYDELPSETREEVSRHLSSCQDCRAALEELHAIRAALASRLDVSTPASGDWSHFMREPPATIHEREAAAVAAYARRAARDAYPGYPSNIELIAPVWARYCVGCHKIEGDGGTDGPDLTLEGTKHDAATLRRWIEDPEQVDPDADMPAFGDRLSAAQLDAIAEYLASRK